MTYRFVLDAELAFLIEASRKARGEVTSPVKISEANDKIEGVSEDSAPRVVESLTQST